MPFSQNQIWQLRMTDIITLCHKSVTTVKKLKILNYQQERNTCTFASARDKLYHVSYVRTSLAVARLEANDSVYWTFTFFLATSYKNEISLPQSAVHTLSHEVLVKEIKQIRKKNCSNHLLHNATIMLWFLLNWWTRTTWQQKPQLLHRIQKCYAQKLQIVDRHFTNIHFLVNILVYYQNHEWCRLSLNRNSKSQICALVKFFFSKSTTICNMCWLYHLTLNTSFV